VKVDYYSQDVPVSKDYKIDFSKLDDDPATCADAFTIPGVTTPSASGYTAEIGPNGDKVTLTGPGDFKLTVAVDKSVFTGITDIDARKTELKKQAATSIDITGMGAMKIQIGANEGQELAVQIPTVSLYRLGLDESDIKTMDSAQKAIDEIKGAQDYINDVRSRLGAYQNRLEHNATSVDVSNENLTAAYSRIMDVDMAEEMTEYTTQQVLVQAGTSMLAQANERPQQVLQLLQ